MDTYRTAAESGLIHDSRPAYRAADELYLRVSRVFTDATSNPVQTRQQRAAAEAARELLRASRIRRRIAANLLSMERDDYKDHLVKSNVRICKRLTVRALLWLNQRQYHAATRQLLDQTLPITCDDLQIIRGNDGHIAVHGATDIFGSPPAEHLGPAPRPRRSPTSPSTGIFDQPQASTQ